MALFSRPQASPRIIDSGAFGRPMSLPELKSGFVAVKDSPVWRALGQIAMAMREECVEQSGKALASERSMQAALHAGGANACADFAALLIDLSEGTGEGRVKEWFPEKA